MKAVKVTEPKVERKVLGVEAEAVVLDGEVVVTFPEPWQTSRETRTPQKQRVRDLVNKELNDRSGTMNAYSVHNGQFKFYFRKYVSPPYDGYGREKNLADVGDKYTPQFSGEYIIDSDFRVRVQRTKLEL